MSDIYRPEGALISTYKNSEHLSSLANIEKAMIEGRILESTVLCCDSSMRLHVELGRYIGIMEREESVFCRPGETIKDIAVITRVGKPICFKIIGIDRSGGKITPILSRKEAQKECQERFLSTLRAGDIIDARVTHLETFGAFLDVGCGLSSLLSVDSISVSRIAHPKDRLSVGDRVKVVVKSRESESGRIYLTMRELLGTWEENASAFEIGQTVSGIIRSVESYGVFVELAPNLAGLAELKEEEGESGHFTIGSSAAVYIKSILPDRMKIKLVLIDTSRSQVTPQRKELKYYVDFERTSHLCRWKYSPERSRKTVETIFDQN